VLARGVEGERKKYKIKSYVRGRIGLVTFVFSLLRLRFICLRCLFFLKING
jgi:hypothetical protein